jgi:hypothetical protein
MILSDSDINYVVLLSERSEDGNALDVIETGIVIADLSEELAIRGGPEKAISLLKELAAIMEDSIESLEQAHGSFKYFREVAVL